MFCNKCGRENAEKSTFCTWCGTRLDSSSVPIPSIIPQTNIPEQTSQSFAPPETDITEQALSDPEAAPSGNPEPTPEQTAEPEASDPLTQPEQPTAPEPSEPEQTAKSAVWNSEVPLIPPLAENPEKPRKYYTGAHLALCLIVMGVMAAAAGIFAGLYFSVIL